jgi:hypothetical protein
MTPSAPASRIARRHLGFWMPLAAALAFGAEARADDRKACDAAYDQAQTYRDGNKLLQAREQMRICARATCPASMVRDCVGWLAETERAIPSVVVVATDAVNALVANVKVTVDGAGAARPVDGTSWDIDPGSHTFTFAAADGTKVDKTVLVLEGQRSQRVAVTLGQPTAPAPAPGPPPQPATPPPAAAPASPGPESPSAGSPLKTIGYVAGGLGVAGLVVGGVFGAMALSTKGSNCPTETTCAPGTASRALGQGTVSTVGFVAGGVLAAGGLTLVLLAPGPSDAHGAFLRASPAVGSNEAGLVLSGGW